MEKSQETTQKRKQHTNSIKSVKTSYIGIYGIFFKSILLHLKRIETGQKT